MIEIRNIPRQPDENKQRITNIVQNIGSSLGLSTPIKDMEIKNIYRSKSEALVVDFVCTTRKESFLADYRKLNKARRDNKEPLLKTSQVQLASTGPPQTIFISEFLTAKVRRVFYLARGCVKEKKLAAAWTAFGRVYVKKNADSLPIRVEEDEDLKMQIAK